MARVAVIGDALLDVQVVPAEPMRRGSDVPAAITVAPGGQGANVAVRLARRGVETELVCALGRDAAAAIVRDALVTDGVRVRELPVDETGTVIILRDRDGERTMLSQRSPFAALASRAALDAPWLVVSGYLLLEPEGARLAEGMADSPARRVLVGCAVPDDRLAAWRDVALALRPDLLVLNRDEIARLRIESATTGLAVTDADGASVTMGGVDADARTPGGQPAVDTSGAGDAFAAGLVAGLSEAPWPPQAPQLASAVRDAVALASAVARASGAQARVAGEPPARRGR